MYRHEKEKKVVRVYVCRRCGERVVNLKGGNLVKAEGIKGGYVHEDPTLCEAVKKNRHMKVK